MSEPVVLVAPGDGSRAAISRPAYERGSSLSAHARTIESKQMLPGSKRCIQFDRTVMFDHSSASRGEHRTSAPAATRRGLHDGRAEAGIEILDQFPGAPVRHPQRTAGGGNRPQPRDCLQHSDLAWTDPDPTRKIDSDVQAITAFD